MYNRSVENQHNLSVSQSHCQYVSESVSQSVSQSFILNFRHVHVHPICVLLLYMFPLFEAKGVLPVCTGSELWPAGLLDAECGEASVASHATCSTLPAGGGEHTVSTLNTH